MRTRFFRNTAPSKEYLELLERAESDLRELVKAGEDPLEPGLRHIQRLIQAAIRLPLYPKSSLKDPA